MTISRSEERDEERDCGVGRERAVDRRRVVGKRRSFILGILIGFGHFGSREWVSWSVYEKPLKWSGVEFCSLGEWSMNGTCQNMDRFQVDLL